MRALVGVVVALAFTVIPTAATDALPVKESCPSVYVSAVPATHTCMLDGGAATSLGASATSVGGPVLVQIERVDGTVVAYDYFRSSGAVAVSRFEARTAEGLYSGPYICRVRTFGVGGGEFGCWYGSAPI